MDGSRSNWTEKTVIAAAPVRFGGPNRTTRVFEFSLPLAA
jgi:hypothetical protein